jgi:hypothetical protein
MWPLRGLTHEGEGTCIGAGSSQQESLMGEHEVVGMTKLQPRTYITVTNT